MKKSTPVSTFPPATKIAFVLVFVVVQISTLVAFNKQAFLQAFQLSFTELFITAYLGED